MHLKTCDSFDAVLDCVSFCIPFTTIDRCILIITVQRIPIFLRELYPTPVATMDSFLSKVGCNNVSLFHPE